MHVYYIWYYKKPLLCAYIYIYYIWSERDTTQLLIFWDKVALFGGGFFSVLFPKAIGFFWQNQFFFCFFSAIQWHFLGVMFMFFFWALGLSFCCCFGYLYYAQEVKNMVFLIIFYLFIYLFGVRLYINSCILTHFMQK